MQSLSKLTSKSSLFTKHSPFTHLNRSISTAAGLNTLTVFGSQNRVKTKYTPSFFTALTTTTTTTPTIPLIRNYASGTGPTPSKSTNTNAMNVFDRTLKTLQKDKAYGKDDAQVFDYLKDSTSQVIVDRLYDISRRFPVMLNMGCGSGSIGNYITKVI